MGSYFMGRIADVAPDLTTFDFILQYCVVVTAFFLCFLVFPGCTIISILEIFRQITESSVHRTGFDLPPWRLFSMEGG